jgi:thiamine biosynthesis lipoprotein
VRVLQRSFEAMATAVSLTVVDPSPGAAAQLDAAEAVFIDVQTTCSRFDPTADLSRVNAEPDRWHIVPATLAHAVLEAYRAHRITDGLFDPRVLSTLVAWGYDRTLPFAALQPTEAPLLSAQPGSPMGAPTPWAAPPWPAPPPDSAAPLVSAPARHSDDAAMSEDGPTGQWRPGVLARPDGWHLHVGGRPIDLGGIGKGLAVRWAAGCLAGAGRGFLVNAGGDCALSGTAPDRGLWRVGMEDPAGGSAPLLVVEVADAAVATSSIRRRRWRVGGRTVHHLVDPRTGQPGGAGLAAVTVLAGDPAWAEVWSKTLFLHGQGEITRLADAEGLAVGWVGLDGSIGTSPALDEHVVWRADA